MTTSAKFPTQAVLADFGGELAGFPEAVLSGAHDNAVTTITLTATVPSYWPTSGWVTIDSEIIAYAGKSGATLTGCTRGAQSAYAGSAAAAHSDGAKVGPYLSPQTVNQIIAEIIALETQALGGIHNPNLVLNSDFGRRTVFGLAMPEVFADTSGYVVVSGAAPTVASNIVTSTAANELAWCNQSFVWSGNFRASGSFKAVATAGIYQIKLRSGVAAYVSAKQNNGNFTITYDVGGGETVAFTVAQALTLNRWYWIECEIQNQTVIAKLYDTGGTVPGVTKASSTLLQTLSGGVTAILNGHISIKSDQATAQWGGIATGNGGVYVETWLPESWQIIFANFGGALGGQAVGLVEDADSGPIGKQWALRVFMPTNSRSIDIIQAGPDGGGAPSTAYAGSWYVKKVSMSGAGTVATLRHSLRNSAGTDQVNIDSTLSDASSSSWTRVTGTSAGHANVRRVAPRMLFTGSGYTNATFDIALPQLEQGSAATAWRNAPSHPFTYQLTKASSSTTTSAATVELDARDLAANVFLPEDATVTITGNVLHQNTNATDDFLDIIVDGTGVREVQQRVIAVNVNQQMTVQTVQRLAAGKHRIALGGSTSAGTMTIFGEAGSRRPELIITVSAGK